MTLYVVCRSVGSENSKNRPAFYNKTLALASLLRAVENVDVPTKLVFANDGPIPPERVRMMADAGEVLPVRCGSNRSSYRLVLRLPRVRGWAPDDLVWFSEDDYLYSADALAGVVEAARTLRYADYFALYSTLRFDQSATRRDPVIGPQVRADGDADAARLGRCRWYKAVSTTSTFGARVRTLCEDELLLRSAPFVGGAFDHATCLAYQGYRPFSLTQLGGEPVDDGTLGPARQAARRVALTGLRSALNAVALARPEHLRRTLVAPDPELATHMEGDKLAPGTDWAAEAASVMSWWRARGPEPVEARSS
jgi:hypothetical protein